MRTDFLRVVEFWSSATPEKPVKGIFHKWITKEDGTVIALIEEFYDGRIAFVETKNMRFLNFWQTKDFWVEIENRPLL